MKWIISFILWIVGVIFSIEIFNEVNAWFGIVALVLCTGGYAFFIYKQIKTSK